ncbi:MAG: hypothetical protein ACI30L_08530 [Muribaculaceae bacterium]
MDNSLETLLKQVLELEGLLLIAVKRGDDAPSMVYDMIRQKAAAIGGMAEVKTPYNEQGIDALPEDEPDDDITVEFVDEPEPEAEQPVAEPAVEPEPVVEQPVAEPTVEPEPVAEVEPVAEPAVEPEPVAEEPVAEPVVEPEPVAEQPVAEPAVEPEPVAEVEPELEPDPDDQPLTLDEALQRDMTKDLRQAFSLNDRYRYRRELFGNSDSVMNETLNLIEAMHSFDEAEDYFYNDLQWEHDSPEVADFMVIIKNHFWNKRQQV